MNIANNNDSDASKEEGIAIPPSSTPPQFSTQPLMFSTNHKWTVAMLKSLDDMNAPDYAFT
jgi:hypothetical protein